MRVYQIIGFVFLFLIVGCRSNDSNIGAIGYSKNNPIGKKIELEIKNIKKVILAHNKETLLRALDHAKRGETILIESDVSIDLTGMQNIKIPSGVTLAGTRGKNGNQGALLFSNKLKTFPLFITDGQDCRITGLRIKGPDTLRRTEQMKQLRKEEKYYSLKNSRGIQIMHRNIEVDNSELFGWSHCAVCVTEGKGAYIHHNYIHHNQRHGLGYGVVIGKGTALIEANLFDWNRHHIAGGGEQGSGYEAKYNIILQNSNGHHFDMHGGKDRKDGTNIAGSYVKIHHNTFYNTEHVAIVIRGIPIKRAEIYNNTFFTDSLKAVKQLNGAGGLAVFNNKFNDKVNVKRASKKFLSRIKQ